VPVRLALTDQGSRLDVPQWTDTRKIDGRRDADLLPQALLHTAIGHRRLEGPLEVMETAGLAQFRDPVPPRHAVTSRLDLTTVKPKGISLIAGPQRTCREAIVVGLIHGF
jgi:hypothetical protein